MNEELSNLEACTGGPETCDLHIPACSHKDKEGRDHNVMCFTHELCWFDLELEAYHKKEEEIQCDICKEGKHHCFGGDIGCNCDCDSYCGDDEE